MNDNDDLSYKTMGVLFKEWLEFTIQVKSIFGITFPPRVAGEAIRNGVSPPTLEDFAAITKVRSVWSMRS